METYQNNKALIQAYYQELESASADTVGNVLKKYASNDYKWFGMHPFNEQEGVEAVTEIFWKPFYKAWSPIQRRQDIFMAGTSEINHDEWITSMGHIIGLLDGNWLGFPASRKMTFLRYAEFHCINEDSKICKTALHFDILGVLNQLGINPFTLQTGSQIIIPGPKTHDGLLFDIQDKQESDKTLALVNQMKDDLVNSSRFHCTAEVLSQTWHEDMIWYGPTGIGSTYTLQRYEEQHQGPFEQGLTDIVFNGHKSRFAEGHYACWFGWPNLTVKASGGFMGLPSSGKPADLRVVDIYRREGEKLAENWVFIDLLYWLYQQGLDVLERTRKLVYS